MPASRTGLFESLRQLLATALEIGRVRLDLLVADLQLEKLRLVDAALRALVGLLLLGIGMLLIVAAVVLMFDERYRLVAVAVLALVFTGTGAALLMAARRRLERDDEMLAATRGELERDARTAREP
jgi:uncharacterized membrane protein YqjE